MGVPVIGCPCAVCTSPLAVNKRLRTSALVSVAGKELLIDAGPDFRLQALRYGISALDGLLLTHSHQDHIGGIDELRALHLRSKQPLPCLLSHVTLHHLKSSFHYIFKVDPLYPALLTRFDLHLLPEKRGAIEFAGLSLNYCTFHQLGLEVNGYRIGDLAYISDIREYPDTIFEDLAGVNNLVLSALRTQSSPMHFTIDEAVSFAKRVGAKQTWLTHLAHEIEHEKTNAYLPQEVRLAYDGLSFNFEWS